MRRFFGLVLSLFLVFTLAFVVADSLGYGDRWVHDRVVDFRTEHGKAIAGLVVFTLLVLDLALPLPSSVLMTLSGSLLGFGAGTFVNAAGSLACSALGFGLCRRFGARAFERLIGTQELPRVAAFVQRFGPIGIVFSRSVPMLTEVVSCCAGLGRMRPAPFFTWSTIGTLPVAALYAWAGARADGVLSLPLTIAVAFVVPGIAIAIGRRHLD